MGHGGSRQSLNFFPCRSDDVVAVPGLNDITIFRLAVFTPAGQNDVFCFTFGQFRKQPRIHHTSHDFASLFPICYGRSHITEYFLPITLLFFLTVLAGYYLVPVGEVGKLDEWAKLFDVFLFLGINLDFRQIVLPILFEAAKVVEGMNTGH